MSSSATSSTTSLGKQVSIDMPDPSTKRSNQLNCNSLFCPPLNGDDFTNFFIGLASTAAGFAAATCGIAATVHRLNPVSEDLMNLARIATVIWGVIILVTVTCKRDIKPILHAVAGPLNIPYGAYKYCQHLRKEGNSLYQSLLRS